LIFPETGLAFATGTLLHSVRSEPLLSQVPQLGRDGSMWIPGYLVDLIESPPPSIDHAFIYTLDLASQPSLIKLRLIGWTIESTVVEIWLIVSVE
jgi:hypothetical protein